MTVTVKCSAYNQNLTILEIHTVSQNPIKLGKIPKRRVYWGKSHDKKKEKQVYKSEIETAMPLSHEILDSQQG